MQSLKYFVWIHQLVMRWAPPRQRLWHGGNLWGGTAGGAPTDWWRQTTGSAEKMVLEVRMSPLIIRY